MFVKLDPFSVVDQIVFVVVSLCKQIFYLSIRNVSVLHYLLKLFKCVSSVPTLVR